MSAFQDYFLDTLKYRYADFGGRARRSEYWYFMLFTYLAAIAFMIMMFSVIGFDGDGISPLGYIPMALLGIFALAIIVPSLALTVRRLHDSGKSGWWYLISFIPLGSLVLFVFMVLDGEPHTNKWGPNPKNPELSNTAAEHLLDDDIV